MKILKCKILRLSYCENQKLYSLELTYENGDVERGVTIPFEFLQGKNSIIRYPSLNKARDWLNTPNGLTSLNTYIKKSRSAAFYE